MQKAGSSGCYLFNQVRLTSLDNDRSAIDNAISAKSMRLCYQQFAVYFNFIYLKEVGDYEIIIRILIGKKRREKILQCYFFFSFFLQKFRDVL